MNILVQIGVVCLLVTAATFLASLLTVPVPVSILGIILLFILLHCRILKLHHIEDIGSFFLKNMGFFFIAAGVSILGKYQELESVLWQFMLIIVVTTALTFAVTGFSVKLAMKLQKRLRGGEHI